MLDRANDADLVEVVSLNTLDHGNVSSLDRETRELVERRRRVMGPVYRLSYAEPFQPVRALGTKIYDVHGDEYLDAYNNVASLGHNHPHVVDAVNRQMKLINTNTRYLQRDIVEYAEMLVRTHDAALDNAMFTCTGSEANDLAARIARQVTGGTGIIVSDYAYHGSTGYVSSWSPSSGDGTILGPEVRTVPFPDTLRPASDDMPTWFCDQIRRQIENMKRHGIKFAALVVDTLFSSDGIHPDERVLRKAIDVVHDAGGLIISDEVQPGFGRTGDVMWGYQRSGFVPDIATMGKPMGNGMPIAGLVAKGHLLDAFAENVAYFNTFGGENVPVAAARAVLEVIDAENLLVNSADKGSQLMNGMRQIVASHGVPVDVRGAGMYLGVEFVKDLDSKAPDPAAATAVVNGLRRRRVLTSSAGMYGNVIKVRPPITFSQADVDRYLEQFEDALGDLPGSSPRTADTRDGLFGANGTVREDLRRIVLEEVRDILASTTRPVGLR